MIGVAVVGGGRIGVMHAKIIARLPGARLTGVVIRSRQRTSLDSVGLHDTPLFGDIDEALNDSNTKAVLIAASSDSHVDLIRRAAAAGRHVLCEKPVAFSSAAIDKLQKECACGKTVIQIGYNRRFDPHYARLRDMIMRGDLGRLYMLQIINMDPQRPPMEFIPRSGGMFGDFNSHDFDMLSFLTDEPLSEIYARGANLVDEEIGRLGDIDTAILSIKMRGGALAAVLSSRETNYGYDQRIEVLGEKGGLHVDNVAIHGVATQSPAGSLHAGPMPDFMTRYRDSYVLQAKAFLSAVRGEESVAAGLAEAAAAVRCVEAAEQSQQENRSVVIAGN